MTDQHPITPPVELVEQRWNIPQSGGDFVQEFATFFARWGADQELEACATYIARNWKLSLLSDELICARRPKPPTLKEQALELVSRIEKAKSPWAMSELHTIRCALEALPND